MTRKSIIVASVVLVLLFASVSVIYAQGGGNGNGDNPPTDSPQGHGRGYGYQQGGVGILDADGNVYQRGQGRGQQQGNMQQQDGFGLLAYLPPASDEPLTVEMVELLTDGIMDEYNAYTTYDAILDEFGDVRPFNRIITSELQHADALAFIFERYGLDVPEPDADFVPPQFDSVADACAAGAAAEVANFELYDAMAAAFVDYPDISQVITALRNASEFNHLPAFEACAN